VNEVDERGDVERGEVGGEAVSGLKFEEVELAGGVDGDEAGADAADGGFAFGIAARTKAPAARSRKSVRPCRGVSSTVAVIRACLRTAADSPAS